MAWETVFIDGFDHYSTADIGAKWNFTAGCSISSTVFRNAGKAMLIGSSSTARSVKSIGSARNICCGFGFRTNSIIPTTITTSGAGVLCLTNSIQASALGQIGLALLSDGKFHALRTDMNNTNTFNTPTDLGSTTTVLSVDAWYYVEIKVFIDDTAGALEVRINGVTELSLSGIDTRYQAGADYASFLALLGGNSSNAIDHYFDDLYVRTSNAASAEAGGFLGDVRIKPFYPNGDGTYSQMTPSTGTTHYTLVDETTPGTTDYVSSSTAGHKESFTFQDMSESGSIKAVQLNAYVSKDDAGFRGVDLFVKSGATEDFAATQPLSTTPLYKTKMWEKNPATANDWSQSEFNASEFGERIAADV